MMKRRFDRDFFRQVSTLASILAAFFINIWSNLNPIGDLTIGEISNTLLGDVLVTPANYAFSIWGLIYLGLIGFGIYQLQPPQRKHPDLRKLGYLLVASSIAQILWVFLFQWRFFVLSLGAMVAILLPLIWAYRKLRIGKKLVPLKFKWLVHIPVSIYLAWISVATIVNAAVALYAIDWQGWGISTVSWTIAMVAVAALLGAIVVGRRRDLAFPGVVVWALVAIAIRHTEIPSIAIASASSAIALSIWVGFRVFRTQKGLKNYGRSF
ncbi:tryptophan-rich sensory protein [Oscillatoriales cyanobacterium LEGE 11467]|uniref:Tryptophan-rich sensory protein n=1 Tax=Zarconia navalis LEGE 11467 TaxID=1828826 RepID=A0A928VU45_9CYAN|nr:tryptophan-rich sensory protein [Zarconia navalis]MBE9040384.1 tryptophan-rich sensory protein [Zarconia navalis LEGE 11467]